MWKQLFLRNAPARVCGRVKWATLGVVTPLLAKSHNDHDRYGKALPCHHVRSPGRHRFDCRRPLDARPPSSGAPCKAFGWLLIDSSDQLLISRWSLRKLPPIAGAGLVRVRRQSIAGFYSCRFRQLFSIAYRRALGTAHHHSVK
jgi:hypothetical protein